MINFFITMSEILNLCNYFQDRNFSLQTREISFQNEYGFYDENAFRMTHYCNDKNFLLAYGA